MRNGKGRRAGGALETRDAIIRQEPIDESRLDPADNLEEFGPISDAALDYFDESSRLAAATGRGVIALVPAPKSS